MDFLTLIIFVCIILWLLGMFGHPLIAAIPAYNGGYLIHILLVVAIIVLLCRVLLPRI